MIDEISNLICYIYIGNFIWIETNTECVPSYFVMGECQVLQYLYYIFNIMFWCFLD